MSQRNPDTGLITTLRNIETRLKKLETSYNNSIKRNDIRIGDIVISASDDHGLLVATNVHTKEQTSFAKMGEQAWSFHGLIAITGGIQDTGPAYVTPHDLTVTDIILAFTNTTTAETVVDVTIADKIVTCVIGVGQTTSVTAANVGVFKHQQIYPTLISTGGSTDHDLTIIARFGLPVYLPTVRMPPTAATAAGSCVSFVTNIVTGLSFMENIVYTSDGEYIASNQGTGTAYSTDEGQTWTYVANASAGAEITGNTSGRWISANNKIIRSSDDKGVTWTIRKTIDSLGAFATSFSNATNVGRTEGLASNGTTFVRVGDAQGADAGTRPQIWQSPNGTTWTGYVPGTTGQNSQLSSVIAIGSTYYTAGYRVGVPFFWKSTDGGITWSTLTAPAVATAFDVPMIYKDHNNRIVMAIIDTALPGPSRFFSTSNEGASWTEHTPPSGGTNTEIMRIKSDGVRTYMYTVATSPTGPRFWYSTDLNAWTELATSPYNSNDYLAAGTNVGNFVTAAASTNLHTTDLDC